MSRQAPQNAHAKGNSKPEAKERLKKRTSKELKKSSAEAQMLAGENRIARFKQIFLRQSSPSNSRSPIRLPTVSNDLRHSAAMISLSSSKPEKSVSKVKKSKCGQKRVQRAHSAKRPEYINKDNDSNSSKEDTYTYIPQVANSVTLSTISQSSHRDIPKIGDEERFNLMSLHRVYINCMEYPDGRAGRSGEYNCSKLKYLIPHLPSYLVSPFPK
ncbi:unnamed protein product [Moneuplotes crassus]|uniref:Uncharacterized protein n=1 Tax=Euplotes crassus TaxID=5936 RepID=A0AAD2CZ57_EUPCR|nr:unnamed protein product [Moneuplotes crassus]